MEPQGKNVSGTYVDLIWETHKILKKVLCILFVTQFLFNEAYFYFLTTSLFLYVMLISMLIMVAGIWYFVNWLVNLSCRGFATSDLMPLVLPVVLIFIMRLTTPSLHYAAFARDRPVLEHLCDQSPESIDWVFIQDGLPAAIPAAKIQKLHGHTSAYFRYGCSIVFNHDCWYYDSSNKLPEGKQGIRLAENWFDLSY